MALTDDQNEELEEMLECINNNPEKLNQWEKDFADDNYKRWQKYGKNIFLSEKQWEVIIKLYNKAQE